MDSASARWLRSQHEAAPVSGRVLEEGLQVEVGGAADRDLARFGVSHQHLALHAVGIPEEQAELAAEVGDRAVGRASCRESGADLAEVLEAGRVQADVVEPAPTEHRRLVVGLVVAVDLEDVQLGGRTDVDHGHARPAGELLAVELHGGPEHVDVERLEPVGVVGNDGHMVESLSEHQVSTSHFADGVARPNLPANRCARMVRQTGRHTSPRLIRLPTPRRRPRSRRAAPGIAGTPPGPPHPWPASPRSRHPLCLAYPLLFKIQHVTVQSPTSFSALLSHQRGRQQIGSTTAAPH